MGPFRHHVIHICGPDGAGKTTQALLLAGMLRRQGRKVVICRIRGTHTLASLLARFMSKFQGLRGSDIPFFGIRIPARLKPLWYYVELLSLLPHLLRCLLVYPLLGYTVIFERSLIDFIVWNIFILRRNIVSNTITRALLLFMHKSPSICIYADPRILATRKQDEKFLIYSMTPIYIILSEYAQCSVDTSKNSLLETHLKVVGCLQAGNGKRMR